MILNQEITLSSETIDKIVEKIYEKINTKDLINSINALSSILSNDYKLIYNGKNILQEPLIKKEESVFENKSMEKTLKEQEKIKEDIERNIKILQGNINYNSDEEEEGDFDNILMDGDLDF